MLYSPTFRTYAGRVLALILVAALLCGATSLVRSRKSILKGTWFPADQQALFTAVRQYTSDARDFAAPGKLVACIVPHAPMAFTGPLSGGVFKQVVRGAYDNVIVLTGFHYGTLHGASMPAVQIYETPMGDLPVDSNAIRELTWNPLIVSKSVSYNERLFAAGRTPLHEREHGIEAVLPYLQVQLGTFRLVPLVVGELNDLHDHPDKELVDSMARSIRPLITERTLIVCATHLTQYGTAYHYTPFRDNVQKNIQMQDLEILQFVSRRDLDGYLSYLKTSKNPVDGAMALAVFIRLLPKGVRGELMQRTTTGLITGKDDDSVSLAAVAFFDPALPVPQPSELRPDLLAQPEPAGGVPVSGEGAEEPAVE